MIPEPTSATVRDELRQRLAAAERERDEADAAARIDVAERLERTAKREAMTADAADWLQRMASEIRRLK